MLREADAVVQDEVRAAGLEREIWQSFAVLLPMRTVGVMGDFRTYAQGGRAAHGHVPGRHDGGLGARCPTTCSARISNRIINEVHGVNRVVFDITSKPPGTIEWE